MFRADRIESAEILGDGFATPDEAEVEKHVKDGRVFVSESPVTLRVRYSPRIARWIEEREHGTAQPDGSFIVDRPLADMDWAVRHVLQYGPEVEVLEPAEAREAVRNRLLEMAG